MKALFRKLKKYWITVWLAVAVIGVGTFVAFASYTGIYSVKRVVSTTASAGMLFSSNGMQKYSEPSIPPKHITTLQANGNYTYNLTVCDYAQSDPLTRYISEAGILYDLTAQLCVKIGEYYYPINDTTNVPNATRTDAASRTFSIQFVSDGGTPTSGEVKPLTSGAVVSFKSEKIKPQRTGATIPNGANKYAIVFDGYELSDNQTIDYYIKLKATPKNKDSSLEAIACYLYLTKLVGEDASWKGELQEKSGTTSYDAYNYILEGSGSGNVTIRWNSSFVDVSEIFIAQNGLNVTEESPDANNHIWKYFVLPVDGTTSRYEIQLYKTNPVGDYSNVSGYISSSYSVDQ